MKVLRQILTGVVVLTLAMMIVDCSENLQGALDEQISKLVAGQLDTTTGVTSKVESSDETQVHCAQCHAAGKQPEIQKKATETSPEPDTSSKEAKEKDVESAQRSDNQISKLNKYKVITITIPEDPSAEVLVKKSYPDQKSAVQHDKPESSSELAPVDARANPNDEESQRLAGSVPDKLTEKVIEQEERLVNDQRYKTKADKKMKGKSAKRDKRETKRSGSGKNGKARRSAEKSKKYENKKKSKK